MKRILLLLLLFYGCENEDQVTENGSTPSSVTLSLSNNILVWTMNNDDDFSKYSVYGSSASQNVMENSIMTLIYETETSSDTSYTLDSSDFFPSYQVYAININESIAYSNIVGGWINLWDKFYSIENTDSLIIHGGGITGEIPIEIGILTNLTILSLVDNPLLTGSIPPHIGNLINLTQLNLYNNNLTGEIPYEIGNLTDVELEIGMYNLTQINLSDNQLTGEIAPQMGNLTKLTHLNLSGNQLEGALPSDIGDLNKLVHLNLKNNNLKGAIPSAIGNLNYLAKLHLNNNQFEALSVSYNEVTGEIEETLCNLNIIWSDTSKFNISNNQLCPPYLFCIEEYIGVQDTSSCP